MDKKRLCLFVGFIVNALFLSAQGVLNTPQNLHDVVLIVTKRIYPAETGKKFLLIDSTALAKFNTGNLGELIGANTPVFNKSYGPGAISTLSMRGGNASHTAIIWRGLNIQNSLLGQTDLSLIPNWFFDEVTVSFGGSSSLWGSGAAAGVIHLGNVHYLAPTTYLQTQISGGSFNQYQAAIKFKQSSQKESFSLAFNRTHSANKFPFKSLNNEIQVMNHAAYSLNSLLASQLWILNDKHSLNFDLWASHNQRQVPLFNALDHNTQTDNTIKSVFGWQVKKKNNRIYTRAALLSDQINYQNFNQSLLSNALIHQVFIEHEHNIFVEKHMINAGISINNGFAKSSNYSALKQLGRASVFLFDRYSLVQNRLIFSLAARWEYFTSGNRPFTATGAFEWSHKQFTIGASAANVFRQPTFNERYWSPGGNPDIKPEKGYTTDAYIKWTKSSDNYSMSTTGSIYSRWMNDWIIWLPGIGYNPVAANINKVWSRGTEVHFNVSKKIVRFHKNYCGVNLNTSYNLSTIKGVSQQSQTNTINKQLIYTPRYVYNLHGWYKIKQFTCDVFYQYVGYRFTSTDNTNWLNPYHIINLQLNYKHDQRKLSYSWFLKLNNLTNTNYQVINGYPMPLFGIEGGLNLLIIKQNPSKSS